MNYEMYEVVQYHEQENVITVVVMYVSGTVIQYASLVA